MNKEMLLQSARELVAPGADAITEFNTHQDEVAAKLALRIGKREDLDRLIGAGNRDMMEDNSRNFCRFMGSLFAKYEPEVFLETVLWVFRAYRSHGFQTTYWAASLDTVIDILREKLSPSAFSALYPFYHWITVHIPAFTKLSDENLQASSSKVEINHS